MMRELREARLQQGISQFALANKAGYHSNEVNRWERGHNQPSLTSFVNLAKALGYRVKLEKIDAEDTRPSRQLATVEGS